MKAEDAVVFPFPHDFVPELSVIVKARIVSAILGLWGRGQDNHLHNK